MVDRLRLLVFAFIIAALPRPVGAQTTDESYKVVDGLAVYLGVLPAAMIQGHPVGHPETAMHGGVPQGAYAYHIVAAVFDAKTGNRIENAAVEAQLSPLGLAGPTLQLEPMLIEGTITYGGYVRLNAPGPYRIRLRVTPEGAEKPTTLQFTYEREVR